MTWNQLFFIVGSILLFVASWWCNWEWNEIVALSTTVSLLTLPFRIICFANTIYKRLS